MHNCKDQIWGTVNEVVDHNTVVVERVAGSRLNGLQYNDVEHIRIQALSVRPHRARRVQWTRAELERALLGERVELLVHHRDDRGRVLVDLCW